MLHARDLIAMPLPVYLPTVEPDDHRWKLTVARSDLLRAQAKLHDARRWRASYAIEFWEQRVIEAIDCVFDAQENWKAVKRHWA